MKKAILATKVGMTQIFNEDGVLVPVTVLQAGPCVVTQVKTAENDGYSAVQVGFVDKKDKTINKDASGKKEIIHEHGTTKAMQGHFKKAGTTSKRYVREFRFENAEEYTLGTEIKAGKRKTPITTEARRAAVRGSLSVCPTSGASGTETFVSI